MQKRKLLSDLDAIKIRATYNVKPKIINPFFKLTQNISLSYF